MGYSISLQCNTGEEAAKMLTFLRVHFRPAYAVIADFPGAVSLVPQTGYATEYPTAVLAYGRAKHALGFNYSGLHGLERAYIYALVSWAAIKAGKRHMGRPFIRYDSERITLAVATKATAAEYDCDEYGWKDCSELARLTPEANLSELNALFRAELIRLDQAWTASNAPILCVAGTFGDKPKASNYAAKVVKGMSGSIQFINGGTLAELEEAAISCTRYPIILWWANVANDAPVEKWVRGLKQANPTAILVISKNNRTGTYDYIDFVARMLQAHASLSLIIDELGGKFVTTLLDPLGNSYVLKCPDPSEVGRALSRRLVALQAFHRRRSKSLGPSRPFTPSAELGSFLGHIRQHAEQFHTLVHGANPSRFLGNASFRCTNGGFPAWQVDGRIFVSRRNLDKRDIAPDTFVEVTDTDTGDSLGYYGDSPPSVDAPIQLRLFQALPAVRYILHAHVYLQGAIFTKSNIPCGALEEVEEILVHRSAIITGLAQQGSFQLNLRGHGCLILATEPQHLANLQWEGRPLPEAMPC